PGPAYWRVGDPAVKPPGGGSASGILADQDADVTMTRQLTWIDRYGLPVRAFSPRASVTKPRLSPAQLSIVGTRPTGSQDIWVTNLIRESSERKTFDDTPENFAVWSKDGSRVAFLRMSGIYEIDVDDRGKPKLLTETPGIPLSWSRQHLL